MLDQAHTLRQLVQAAPAAPRQARISPRMIVVAGGRGGVGATTVAANLGAVLADRGERVVLVDGAAQDGDLAVVTGIGAALERSLNEVIAGDCRATEALAPGPAGTLVLANRRDRNVAQNISRPAQQQLFSELQTLESVASVLVVDAGRAASPWMRRFWLRAGMAIVVTTSDDLALMDAYALIKQSLVEGVDADVRVLVNQCDSDAAADGACGRLANACQRFLSRTVRALPALPRHVAKGDAGRSKIPRVWERPDSPFGHAMLWLGRAVGDAIGMRDEG